LCDAEFGEYSRRRFATYGVETALRFAISAEATPLQAAERLAPACRA